MLLWALRSVDIGLCQCVSTKFPVKWSRVREHICVVAQFSWRILYVVSSLVDIDPSLCLFVSLVMLFVQQLPQLLVIFIMSAPVPSVPTPMSVAALIRSVLHSAPPYSMWSKILVSQSQPDFQFTFQCKIVVKFLTMSIYWQKTTVLLNDM